MRLAGRATVVLSAWVGLVSGCTVVSDLDSFEQPRGCDLEMQLRSFAIHRGDRFEVRVVSESDRLRARAVLEPFGADDLDLSMPFAVEQGKHFVDFFADYDTSGGYTDPPDDHAWRVEDPCVDPPVVFEHQFDFTPLPDAQPRGEDFHMELSGMSTGGAFELRIVEVPPEQDDEQGGRTVGLYRTPAIEAPAFTVDIAGIIRTDRRYILSMWADRDGDAAYDAPNLSMPDDPTADEAWRLRVDGGDATDVEFAHVPEHTDIGGILVDVLSVPEPDAGM